jgi:phospholipid/cholesterol/gamma-HCH transport system permease protein
MIVSSASNTLHKIRNTLTHGFDVLVGYFSLAVYVVWRLRTLKIYPVRTVLYRQIYFTGWESHLPVALLALMCGALVTTQTIRFAGGDSVLVVRAMAWLFVRELGPLLAAMIIIGRSCPAIASELALMKVRGELDSLKHMGISPLDYLIVPRVLGVSLALAVLTLLFELVATIGGLGFSAMFQNVSFVNQIGRFLLVVNPFEFLGSGVKGFVFGMLISSISCFHGMSVGTSVTEVPQAVIKAVTRSMVAVFVFDLLLSAPRYIG